MPDVEGIWTVRLRSLKKSKMNLTRHAITHGDCFGAWHQDTETKKTHHWRVIQSKAMWTGVGWGTMKVVDWGKGCSEGRRNGQKSLCHLDQSTWMKAKILTTNPALLMARICQTLAKCPLFFLCGFTWRWQPTVGSYSTSCSGSVWVVDI